MSNACIPFKGNKSAIGEHLLRRILAYTARRECIYDLCGGSGFMSFLFTYYFERVVYVDASDIFYLVEAIVNRREDVMQLVEQLKQQFATNKINKDTLKVMQEMFFECINKKEKNWQDVLILLVFSFGNNGRSFIYGQNRLERLQHLEHLPRLQRLEVKHASVGDISIESSAVIYCDPPYRETTACGTTYNHNFNFFELIKKKSTCIHVRVC